MKWTTTLALILAASTAALWVNDLLTPDREQPQALLARLAAEGHAGMMEQRAALLLLTAALEGPEAAADPDLAMALYRARAKAYRELGLLGSALADLEQILANSASAEVALELEACELMALLGQTDLAGNRVRKLVEGIDPSDASAQPAFELLGQLESTLAERYRSRAIEDSVKSLDEKGGRRATEIIVEASARGESDPRTSELLSELRGIFRVHKTAPISQVLDLVTQASRASLASTKAFARSMQLGPTPRTVTEVAELLEAVGREDQAASLLLAARNVTSIERSAPAVASTLRLLDRTGRLERALSIASTWDRTWGGDLEFYRSATALMFRAEMGGAVNNLTHGMAAIGGDLADYWAEFYFKASTMRGIAYGFENEPAFQIPVELTLDCVDKLYRFARNKSLEEPYPGARTDVWFIIAAGVRMLGNVHDEVGSALILEKLGKVDDAEKSALLTGLISKPSAEHWIRVAELEERADVPAWDQIEWRYTSVLELEPKRTFDLLERWTTAGDRALASASFTLAKMIEEARNSYDGRPLRTTLGASVVWRIAEAHLRARRIKEASLVASDLLELYPRLVPALDTRIEAELSKPAPSGVANLILRRIELVGGDARTDAYLARLPEPLAGEHLTRAMRAAPERLGRPTAARLALEEGEPERAADLLDALDTSALSPTLRELRGKARLEAGRFAAASEDYSVLLDDPALLDDPEEGARVLLGALEVSLRSGDRAQTDALVQRVTESLPSRLRLDIVESLMHHGRLELAQQVLGQLDQAVDSRTPEFYAALVRHAAATRDTSTIGEAIARAEAYARDGAPEIAELLLSIRDRNWLALPEIVGRLRKSNFAPTPFEDTCLTLLEERLAHGRRLAERSTAAESRSPEWTLLNMIALALEGESLELPAWFGARAATETTEVLLGSRRGRRDPRELLAVLLLLDRKEWRPWVEQELRLLREQPAGRLWPTWLEVVLHSRSGADDLARARTDELLAEFADFGPAWDRRLAFVTAAHATDPLAVPLLETRVARLHALGELAIEDPVELALARASVEVLAGSDDKAMFELARTLTRERRADFAAKFTLGALLVRAGEHGLAADHLQQAATNAPPESSAAVATALVDSILRAASPTFQRRAPIPAAELPTRLEAVIRLFPTDPMASSVWIRHGSDMAQGGSQRAALARLELTRLRHESGQQSLETMRRGSTRTWVDLTLEVAPEDARALVDAELELRPGDVELWELAATIATQFGDRASAETSLRTVLAIAPRASAHIALAELLVRRGAPKVEIDEHLSTANQLAGGQRTARTRLLFTELRMRDPFPDFRFITGELEALWMQREQLDGTITASQIGFALVAACLQWADDLERLRAALLAHPPAEGVQLPDLPAEAELAERALATLTDLEAVESGNPHTSALVQCYRGIAAHILRDQAGP